MYEHQLEISAANCLIETFKHLVEFGRQTFLQPTLSVDITDCSIKLGKTRATAFPRPIKIEDYDSLEIMEEHFGLSGFKRIDVNIWGQDEAENQCMLGLTLDGGKCLSTSTYRIMVLLSTSCDNPCLKDHERSTNYEFLPLGLDLLKDRKNNSWLDSAYLKMLWLFGEVVSATQGKFGCKDLRVIVGNWSKSSAVQMWFSNCEEPFLQEWRREQLDEFTEVHYTDALPTISEEQYQKFIVQHDKRRTPPVQPELQSEESIRSTLLSYAGRKYQEVHVNFFENFPVLVAPRNRTIRPIMESIWKKEFWPVNSD